MILNMCETSVSVLEATRIIINVVKIITTLVPVILIITNIISLFKVFMNDMSKLADTVKLVITKTIVAAFIFFIPTIFHAIFNLADIINSSNVNIADCINNANSEGINKARAYKIDDRFEDLEKDFSKKTYNKIKTEIYQLDDSNTKKEYYQKLSTYEPYVNVKSHINSVTPECKKKDVKKIYEEIDVLDNAKYKEYLTTTLENACKEKYLDTDAGTYKETNELTYYVNVPENATTNMMLVMYLHGDGGNDNSAKNNPFYTNAKKIYGDEYPFIIVAPVGGMWKETAGRLDVLKNIIDSVCNEYSCDTDKIVITGHSRGAIGTWALANKYPDMFYAAVPISCNSGINAKNFINMKVRAYCGNQGDDINYYYKGMKSNVNSINNAGGNAEFITLNSGHGGTPNLAYNEEFYTWLLEE